MLNLGGRTGVGAFVRFPTQARRRLVLAACLLAFFGAATNADRAAVAQPVSLNQATPLDAFRFLTQASFGPTAAELHRVQSLGTAAYLEDQFNQPQSGYPDAQYTYLSLKTSADCNNKDPSGANYPASAPQAICIFGHNGNALVAAIVAQERSRCAGRTA